MVALFLWQQQSYLVLLLQRVKIGAHKEYFLNLANIFGYYTLFYNRHFSYFLMLYRIFTELWATELHHHLMNFSGATIAEKEFFEM